ncbi:MAG TPA: hypothetical protein VGL82_12305 [Bryobacteraceae bacterium]
MSKSLLLIFSSLAFLAGATGTFGGVRLGEFRDALRSEMHADIRSIKESATAIRIDAERTPGSIRSFWRDVCRRMRSVKEDATDDQRHLRT